MIVLKSTHDRELKLAHAISGAACADRDNALDRLALEREEKRKFGQALHEKVAECEALQAKIARMTGGLRLGTAASAAKRAAASPTLNS